MRTRLLSVLLLCARALRYAGLDSLATVETISSQAKKPAAVEAAAEPAKAAPAPAKGKGKGKKK